MPKIINPFRGTDPIAQTLSQLGQNMFGDQTGAAKRKEDLYTAQRTNAETDNLMGLIGQNGSFGSFKSPIGQAMALGAGMKGGDMGDYALTDAGLNFGAADQRTQNAQVASGQSYDNTANAVGAKLAEVARNNNLQSTDRRYGVDQSVGQQRYEFDHKPMPALDALGKPAFATQGAFDGFSPILSNTEAQGTFAQQNFGQMGGLPSAEQNYLGADSATSRQSAPKNYVAPDGQRFITYDGVTNAQDNSPLPTGGYIAGVQGGAEEALGANGLSTQGINTDQNTIRAAQRYFSISSQLRTLATEHPESFGLLGSARGSLQELAQTVPAVGALFGNQNVDAALNTLVKDLSANPNAQGMLAKLLSTYDGSLPTVQTLGVMYQYSIANGLLGQTAQSTSDKEMARIEQAAPNPQDWFTSAPAMIQKIDVFDNIMKGNLEQAQARLNSGSINPTMPGAPPPAADPAASAGGDAPEGAVVVNQQTGERLTLRNGQWEPL